MSVLNRAAPSSVTAPGSQQMLGACDTFPGQEKASLPHCQLCKKCQHLLAALQQVGGLQTHGKSCCRSSAVFFQTVRILRGGPYSASKGKLRNNVSTSWRLYCRGGCAAIMWQLGCTDYNGHTPLTFSLTSSSASVSHHDFYIFSTEHATHSKWSWQYVTV